MKKVMLLYDSKRRELLSFSALMAFLEGRRAAPKRHMMMRFAGLPWPDSIPQERSEEEKASKKMKRARRRALIMRRGWA